MKRWLLMENKYEQLLYEKQRNGVLITLNRPEVMNAISDQLDANSIF